MENIGNMLRFINNLKKVEKAAEKFCRESGLYSSQERYALGFVRRKMYAGKKWFIAAGEVSSAFNTFLETKNPELAAYFGDDDSEAASILDPSGNILNGIHMVATLSSKHVALFGYVADVFSNAKNIKKWRNNYPEMVEFFEEKYRKNIADVDQKISDIVMGNLEYNCSMADIMSDIDAIFIKKGRSSGEFLSDAIYKYYYNKEYINRFNNFAKYISKNPRDFEDFKTTLQVRIEGYNFQLFEQIKSHLCEGVSWEHIRYTIFSFCKLVAVNTNSPDLYKLADRSDGNYTYGDKYESYVATTYNTHKESAQEILIDRPVVGFASNRGYFKFKVDSPKILKIQCDVLSSSSGMNFGIYEDYHNNLNTIYSVDRLYKDGTEKKYYILKAEANTDYYISTSSISSSKRSTFRISVYDLYGYNDFTSGLLVDKEIDLEGQIKRYNDEHKYILTFDKSGYKRLKFWSDRNLKINIELKDMNGKKIMNNLTTDQNEAIEQDVYFEVHKPYYVRIFTNNGSGNYSFRVSNV